MDGASAFDKKSSNSSRTGSFIINNSILFLFSPIFYFFCASQKFQFNREKRRVFSQSWVCFILYFFTTLPITKANIFLCERKKRATITRQVFARQISRFLSFVHLLANRCTRSAKIVTCLSPLLHNLPSIDPRPSE